jgi:iron complex outermembrane recepter protein
MIKNHKLNLRLALLASATLIPAIVWAQTTPPAPDEGVVQLDEIVVTAQRRETNLQDTPISVTAVTAQALEARGIRTVNDLAASVPNLTSTTGPQGSSDANFFVRGVGQFDVIATNDPGVGIYVDGVYLGRTVGAMLDSGDIGRVEVLRGPQGTLFGRNTLGGAISVTSKAPELGIVSGNMRGTFGSRSRVEVDGSVNAPVGDIAAVRLYAFTRNQNGFATRVSDGVKFGKTKRFGGKAQILLAPSDDLKITVAADYALDRSNPAPSVNLGLSTTPPFTFFFPPDAGNDRSTTNFYSVYSSNDPEARNRTYGFSATIAYTLGGATLKSITAYRNLDGFSTSDPDGTGYRLYDQIVTTKQNQFSQELQIAGQALNDKLTYLAGGYFFSEKVDQVLALCFAPITPPPAARLNSCNTWTQGNNQKTSSYAAFGQASFNFTDQLSLTLGARYTYEKKNIISNQLFDFRPAGTPFNPTPGAPPPGLRIAAPIVTDLADSVSFKKFTPKIGVEFKASDDVLVFASYAKGFRSGGFNGRLIAPQTSIPEYKPDTNDSFELGLKSDFNKTLRLNATIFYSKYKDIQQTITDPVVQFRVANAGQARLYGFEAEITAVPTAGLQFNAGIGYTNSKFEKVPEAVGPINGNKLPFSPEWTFSAGAQYAIDLADYGTLTPRADFRFQSRTYFTAFNLPLEQQPGYGLASLRLTYATASDRFSVSIYGDNLTDKNYYTFGQNALGSQGVAYAYLGRPREFGITGEFKF